MDDQKESRAGLAVVVAVLILTLVGPFIVTVWTAALLKTTMRNGCAAVSLDSNGVGQGGQGYTVVSYNLRGAQLSAASGGMGAHKGDYAWSNEARSPPSSWPTSTPTSWGCRRQTNRPAGSDSWPSSPKHCPAFPGCMPTTPSRSATGRRRSHCSITDGCS